VTIHNSRDICSRTRFLLCVAYSCAIRFFVYVLAASVLCLCWLFYASAGLQSEPSWLLAEPVCWLLAQLLARLLAVASAWLLAEPPAWLLAELNFG